MATPKTLPKTKAQIIAAVAEAAEITKVQAKLAIDKLITTAYKGAKDKKGFTIPGLGKLVLVQRKARKGINPQTKQIMNFPAKKVVKFRVAKAAKDAILAK